MTLVNRIKNLRIVQPLVRAKYRTAPLVDLLDDPKGLMLRDAFQAADDWGLKGGYFEFGVYRGRSFIRAAHLAQDRHRLGQRRLYAFDSFEGLSEPTAEEGADVFAAGTYACTQAQFVANCQDGGVDMSRVEVHPGFLADSLTDTLRARLLADGEQAAVVWIDVDIYEPARQALDWLTPLLQDGTIVCFDDWYSYAAHPMKGEPRAAREWLAANPDRELVEWRNFGRKGKAFIVTPAAL